MGEVVNVPSAIEPTEWFVVFDEKSANRWLSLFTPGRFKHVSAFGYCPGVKVWLLYDVQLSGTRVMLLDKNMIVKWSQRCTILKIARTNLRMGYGSRICFHCVTAVKHLIGLRGCVAVTPDQLYRYILRNGGTAISEPRQPAAAASRS